MKFFGIIPARYESSRFPGKPLAMIHGKPMIHRVWERSSACQSLSGLVVATDDDRIRKCVESFGGNVIMTSPAHHSGTERCNEATGFWKEIRPDDVIVNIQGDEPFINPGQIDQVCECFTDKNIEIGTLVKEITSVSELADPNVVKVIFDKNRKAIYFSRHPIPYLRGKELINWLENGKYYKHIGLYGYTVTVLRDLVALTESLLEKSESLEQLRWIDHGYSIQTRATLFESIAIDTPADLLKITNTP